MHLLLANNAGSAAGVGVVVDDCVCGLLWSSHDDDDGLYGEPGSEPSLEAVLESVQLSVATPLNRWKEETEADISYAVQSSRSLNISL